MTVDQLATMFDASPETIRRDLTRLSADGKIEKIHGSAIVPRFRGEGPFQQRMLLNGPAKRYIAKLARQLVSAGDTVFIDTGSTTLAFAENLGIIDDLTVITNSTAIAKTIKTSNVNTEMFLLGGSYNEDNQQTCGVMAINQLAEFHGNLAILAVGAIDARSAVTDYSCDEAQLAKAMLQRAERTILLVDSSKFDKSAAFTVSNFDQINTMVCDQAPTGALAEALSRANIEVVYA